MFRHLAARTDDRRWRRTALVIAAASIALALLLVEPPAAPPTPTPRAVAAPPQADPTRATTWIGVAGTDLQLLVPASWWPGGVRGPGVLVSLIGGRDGYPAFSVQTDPELAATDRLSRRLAHRALEQLQGALDAGREVAFARWVQVNGLAVLSSRTSFSSPAGHITVRRLLLHHRGRPYIFSWAVRTRDYAALEPAIEEGVESLRRGDR